MLIEIVSSILHLIFFFIGIRVGMSLKSDKPIIPKPTTPAEWHRTKESKRIEEERQKEVSIMLDNIDNYDGTGTKQKDIK